LPKYNYDETDCDNKDEFGRVKVICPIHGEFLIRPSHHKSGHGCRKCGHSKMQSINKDDRNKKFLKKVKEIYGEKYDFTKSIYHDYYSPIEIICPKHGPQYRTPLQIYNGAICPQCTHERRVTTKLLTTDEFIKKAIKKHKGKYTYNHCNYIGAKHDVIITCPKHGDFVQNANSHLNGRGCPKCSKQRFRFMTNEEREQCFRKIHGDKYEYDWDTYIKNRLPMNMFCKKHGLFQQSPSKHLFGEGCPKCKRSRLEEEIEQFLLKNNIEFIPQYKQQWLGLQSLDFYLPKYKIGIECQGGQHFFPIKLYGGEDAFKQRLTLDRNKLDICKEYNIKILYYSNLHIDYPYEVFEDKDKMLQEITNGDK
jgi:predicted  nucleic acid-binding Zn-ribbon protein